MDSMTTISEQPNYNNFFRQKLLENHPDKGGDSEKVKELIFMRNIWKEYGNKLIKSTGGKKNLKKE